MQEPLVFLPGMMCDARLFSPQIAAFSHDRAVMTIPLTGHDTMTELATSALAIAPPRFALAGLSMGGIVAMEMMRQAPRRISRLALLDTNPLADPPEKAELREAQVARAQNGALEQVMRDEMKPNYLSDGPRRAAILDLCMDMAGDLGPQVFADQSAAIQHRPDQSGTLKTVRVPALVLCGEDDRLCPVSRHELMHKLIPGSQLAVIPGAGHMPTLEQPEQTNRKLKKWLTQ
ncbi:alpha/beta fold hydrolase [uncultured Roseobacter sp.]|uniref:alpha/beta fold hydrolase n=1 Tax=uncultured Roseobacter sp. TaxID=114847 RepID=UPI00262EFFA5|nr:alpha/beta fold hydrolase [uncultured Roseobacter sp.]